MTCFTPVCLVKKTPPYTHEAGEFILRNLKIFPNELPETAFDVLRHPKMYVSSPPLPKMLGTAICGMGTPVMKMIHQVHQPRKKRMLWYFVMNLFLLPVLHSIPSEAKNVNITMGFPLAQTPVYSFISALIELQTNGYRRDTGRYSYEAVQAVMKHPYTRQLSPSAEKTRETADERQSLLPSAFRIKAR